MRRCIKPILLRGNLLAVREISRRGGACLCPSSFSFEKTS